MLFSFQNPPGSWEPLEMTEVKLCRRSSFEYTRVMGYAPSCERTISVFLLELRVTSVDMAISSRKLPGWLLSKSFKGMLGGITAETSPDLGQNLARIHPLSLAPTR